MPEMVERVARAIQAAKINGQRQGFTDEYATVMARAAIAAMRELTPEMTDTHPPMTSKQEFLASYRAMIDAALTR